METLTNQEFIYRQTPASQDGTGTITSIYGNTLKWNQLNTNIGASETYHDVSFTKNDDGSWTINGTPSATNTFVNINYSSNESRRLKVIQGHKYYVKGADYDSGVTIRFIYTSHTSERFEVNNELIFESLYDDTTWMRWQVTNNFTVNNYKGYPQIFDLTMLGIDNLTLDEVKQWFADYYPLPFYQYDSGSLLPFRGEGLKTVGKNLLEFDDNWESTTRVGVTATNNHDGTITLNGTATSTNILILNFANASLSSTTQNDNKKHLQNGTYKVFGLSSGTNLQICESNVSDNSGTEATRLNNGGVITITNEYKYNWIRLYIFNGVSFNNTVISPMIMFEDVTDETFEPYWSSTLSLPIQQYFPSGMKNAGSVYDELTPSKAKTRISSFVVNGNSVNYHNTASTGIPYVSGNAPQDVISNSNNIKTVDYLPIATAPSNSGYIRFMGTTFYLYDNAFADLATAKSILNANPVTVYYESATPTEVDISTSLDLTFPIDVGGTEQLLPINEEAPTTAPIICDIDYRGMIPVNATVDPTGSGTIEGLGDYRYHSTATLIAEPTDEIYRFLRWEDENQQTLSTNSEYSFQVGE